MQSTKTSLPLLQEYMSCFGGLSQVLTNIAQVLRLHCGTIVCAPGLSGQDSADQLALSSTASSQDLGAQDQPAAGAAAAAAAALKGRPAIA